MKTAPKRVEIKTANIPRPAVVRARKGLKPLPSIVGSKSLKRVSVVAKKKVRAITVA